jgi:hypothetical protein
MTSPIRCGRLTTFRAGVAFMSPEKRILQAIESAQNILARYVEPGPRDPKATLNALLNVLDDDEVVQAVLDLKRVYE